jgi:general secretion pathway protein I
MTTIVRLKNNTASGFSLLEVMVAVGILGFSMAAIYQMFGTSMATSARAEAVTMATLLARQKISEQIIKLDKDQLEGKFPGTDEESEGEFDEPYKKYKWKLKVRKVEIPMPQEEALGPQAAIMQMISKQINEAVREVKLAVTWEESSEQRDVTVTTHVVKK